MFNEPSQNTSSEPAQAAESLSALRTPPPAPAPLAPETQVENLAKDFELKTDTIKSFFKRHGYFVFENGDLIHIKIFSAYLAGFPQQAEFDVHRLVMRYITEGTGQIDKETLSALSPSLDKLSRSLNNLTLRVISGLQEAEKETAELRNSRDHISSKLPFSPFIPSFVKSGIDYLGRATTAELPADFQSERQQALEALWSSASTSLVDYCRLIDLDARATETHPSGLGIVRSRRGDELREFIVSKLGSVALDIVGDLLTDAGTAMGASSKISANEKLIELACEKFLNELPAEQRAAAGKSLAEEIRTKKYPTGTLEGYIKTALADDSPYTQGHASGFQHWLAGHLSYLEAGAS